MLIVVASPTPSEIGRIIPIEATISIGRSADAGIALTDPALSKRHLEITVSDRSCTARDLASRNGTFVNGSRLQSSALCAGDQIQIGATLLHFIDNSGTRRDSWVERALGASGVALWEHDADTDELIFPGHIDATLDLAPSTLGDKRVRVRDCAHSDDLAALGHAFAAARSGTPFELELRLQITPTLERWVMMRGQAIGARVVGTIVDITGMKRREVTLSRSALLFESFLDGVVLTDQAGSIAALNVAMAEMFRLVRGDAIGQPLFLALAMADPEAPLREASAAIAATGTWKSTLEIGASTYHDVNAFPLRTDRGEPAGVAWVFRDVTEKRRMATQIAFLDRLVSLGTLSAGVAHEINNPLAFILGNAEHLRERLLMNDRPPIEVVDDIVDGAQRIAAIVRDLRMFARGEVSEIPEGFDARTAIELAVKLAGSTTRASARVITAIESKRRVLAVQARLVQVLINLIINAAQSIPSSRLDATITIRSFDDGDGVAIEVTDEGKGMSPEVIARAFEPFFTTKGTAGTGLGLSICHGLITGMGGRISLCSAVGRGTTVRVWLPGTTELAPNPTVPTSAGTPPRLRVLVIDDELIILRTMARLLAEHEVVAANGYRAATERLLIRRETYDVILCDLMMPDGTGMELHARLIAERPEIVPHMIFVTGDPSESFLSRVTNQHLLKPVSREVLRHVLATFHVA